ncbi:MAG TPA: VWA domain-containing protein [Armatimonadetes bacterium]|nr:VWA domain-containing protein [Armatimonadota bacterium]
MRAQIFTHGGGLYFSLLMASAVWGQGLILPRPIPPVPHPRPLAVAQQQVQVTIKGFAATTHLTQVFYNQYRYQLEGTYLFPLPEGAAVSDFALYIDGERYGAELLEREEARRIYESIVRRTRDPALLEYVGRNLFRARIFPIPPLSEKRIELEYSQTLPHDAGLVSYVFPLKRKAFARPPRPPIRPLRERPRDDPRLYRYEPGVVGEVVIAVDIESQVPIKAVYSPTHDLDVRRRGDYIVQASFEQRNLRPQRDFILYYTLSEEQFGLNLLAHRRYGDEKGYFMLLLAPKHELREQEIAAKDIVFVFDTSGSMSGRKIEQARAALKFCLEHLNRRDRFNVLSFSTGVDLFAKELVPASERRIAEAKEFVEDFRAAGGTAINDGLLAGLKLFRPTERPQMLVFLTDGLPTVGERNVKNILRNVSRANEPEVRCFVFGVGDDVNTFLLDKLSAENRGVTTYVRPGEDLEIAVSSFYLKVSSPVLSDLDLEVRGVRVYDLYPRTLEVRGVRVYDLYPRTLPDLFRGTQLTIFGRYEGWGEAEVILRGRLEGRRETFRYPVELPRRERKNDFIPRLWARRKIGHLLEEIRLEGEDPELREEVIRLATRYGIVTPYTSFLVQEPRRRWGDWAFRRPPEEWLREVPVLGQLRRDRAEAGMPGALGPAGPPTPSLSAQGSLGGSGAVRASQYIAGLKASERESEREVETIRHVGDKTFYLHEEVWVDSDFPEEPKEGQTVLEIKYDSEAYWDLLTKRPELGKYLALGEKVWVNYRGVLLKIGPRGKEQLTAEEWKKLPE